MMNFDQSKYGLSQEYDVFRLPFANLIVIEDEDDFNKIEPISPIDPKATASVKRLAAYIPDTALIVLSEFDLKYIEHEYQHVVNEVLSHDDFHEKYGLNDLQPIENTNKKYLPKALDTREKLDNFELDHFSDEICSYIAEERSEESAKELMPLYNYITELQMNDIDIPSDLTDRKGYMEKCSKLIEVAYKIKLNVEFIYILLGLNKDQINLITVSLLRDTNIQNWPKLNNLLNDFMTNMYLNMVKSK